jgi:hypothetical protein
MFPAFFCLKKRTPLDQITSTHLASPLRVFGILVKDHNAPRTKNSSFPKFSSVPKLPFPSSVSNRTASLGESNLIIPKIVNVKEESTLVMKSKIGILFYTFPRWRENLSWFHAFVTGPLEHNIPCLAFIFFLFM